MDKNITVTILGCGTSSGVPSLEDGWGSINPNNPKNRRTRCAITMRTKDAHILVDCGPDIKDQLFEYSQNNELDFDGLFITHSHADHIHGIDDLRWVNKLNNRDINCYTTKQTFDLIIPRFNYAFSPLPDDVNFYFKPVLQPIEIKQKINIKNSEFIVVNQQHGTTISSGYRYGDFAYCTDVVDFEKYEFDKLRGVKTLIIDCLRKDSHPTHAHLNKVLDWVSQLQPKITYLTHMDNTMDYDELIEQLPDNIRPAYDGLVISA